MATGWNGSKEILWITCIPTCIPPFSFGLVVLMHNSVWEWLAWILAFWAGKLQQILAQKEDFQAPAGSNGQEVFEPCDPN